MRGLRPVAVQRVPQGAKPAGERPGSSALLEPGVRSAREHERENDRKPGRKGDLEDHDLPNVVVAPDREDEPDGDEDEGPGRPEHALHEHRPGGLALRVRSPARVRGDPHRVAADRGREHLARRIPDEVDLRQPAERLVDPLRGEERLPAPGHSDGGREEDDIRREQVPPIARRDQVDRLARSICQMRNARTPALTSTCRVMRTGRLILTASGGEAGVDTSQRIHRVLDVLVRVRRRQGQREHLAPGLLRDRERRLVRDSVRGST